MPELVLPFLYMVQQESASESHFTLADAYAHFSRFVWLFIPNHLHQRSKRTLAYQQEQVLPYISCTLHLTDLLLAYADREVHCHLRRKKVLIESYAASWATTMFSRAVDFALLFELWEVFLFERDRYLIFYFSVALIKSLREKVLATQSVGKLFGLMSASPFLKTHAELAEVYRLAIEIRQRTPVSFQILCDQLGVVKHCSSAS